MRKLSVFVSPLIFQHSAFSFVRLTSLVVFVITILPLAGSSLYAQQYKWVTGGGSSAAIQNLEETVTDMCTDDNGNVYALSLVGDYNIEADTFFMASAFNTGMNPIPHILFTSYNCDGTMRFAKLLEADNSARSLGIAYDKGKVYVSGSLRGVNKRIGYDASFNMQHQCAFLAKFDTSGQYNWTQFIGPDIFNTFLNVGGRGKLAIDGQGNIHCYAYVGGGVQLTSTVLSTKGNYDLKYDVNGSLLSATRLQLADTNFFVKNVAVDKQTNKTYAIMEISGGTTTKSGSYLVAYDPGGNLLWLDSLKAYTGLSNLRFKAGEGLYVVGGAGGLQTFKFGSLAVSNTSYPTGALSTVSKVDPSDGSVKWIRQVNGSTGINAFGDLELLAGNKIAVVGLFNGKAKYKTDSITVPPGGTYHPLLFIIDTAGNLVKLDQLYATGGSNSGLVMTKDNKNSLYLGGFTSSSITATGLTTPYVTNGSTDFFVVKYGYECCTVPTVANFTAVVPNGKVGYFTFTGTSAYDSLIWNFGDGATDTAKNPSHVYSVSDTYTVCVTVYSECGTDTKCQKVVITVGIEDLAMGTISIYPNPFTGLLTIEGAEAGTKIALLNMLGQQLYNGTISSTKETVNTSDLPPGNYILHLTDAAGQRRSIKLTKD
jgi:hypothetical protein